MKHKIFIALALLSLTACHESLEDKADREAKEFTQNECPRQLDKYITIDSMTFERSSRTIHYYYTINGAADTSALDRKTIRAEFLKAVKGNTSIRRYKEEGYNFAYTYFSTKHKGQRLIDITFTQKDYK